MTRCYKVVYLRVSRDDLDESTQLPEILKAFNLNEEDVLILRERISAYNEDVQKDRTEFIKLKKMVEEGVVTDVYVYSLERIERNIIRMFEFFFYCEANNCKVHGVKQPSLELPFENNPVGTFSRYQQVLIFGLLGENESYMTSERTKKSVVRKENKITKSYKGNKWGRSLKYPDGRKVGLDKQEKIYTNIRISILEYERLKFKSYYDLIIKKIENDFGVKISKSYIVNIKKGIEW